MKTYEVILNGPALGLVDGSNVKQIQADRFETDENSGPVTFYLDDEKVAQFQYVLGVSEVVE